MDFSEPEHWATLRREAEEFAAAHVTETMIVEELESGDGANRDFMRALGARGWIAPNWPVVEGGAGLDGMEAAIISDAIRRAGGPTIGYGTTLLPANAIRAMGSPALKETILPNVARGETLICLGYTEPEGGSDVFQCATRSVRDGDEWVINGQKMFTTFGHLADYCFLLTRSDPGSRGPHGLTMFLVPMSTAGIEQQAVQKMGYERTNVVFYTDVRVDDFYRVGEVDGGLHVMRAALEAEQNIAPAARTPPLFEAACAWAEQAAGPDGTRMIDNPRVRDRLARLA